MAQWLRVALATLAKDLSSVLHAGMASQAVVTPVPGEPTLSFGLDRFLHACGSDEVLQTHTHIHVEE